MKHNKEIDYYIFTDKRCQQRALFMTARLKQTVRERQSDSFWRLIAHRLYTFNYILFVLAQSVGKYNPGHTEAQYAVRYALERKRRRKTLLEDAFAKERGTFSITDPLLEHARTVFKQCLESEAQLGQAERDAMYLFHTAQAGLLNLFEPRIECEDRALADRLKRAVLENKAQYTPDYQNPFEDEDFVVAEEEDDMIFKDWDPVEAA